MEKKRLNILHVEDNLVDQMAVSRLLRKARIPSRLFQAATIRAAKEWLAGNEFQLIICDLNLPDGSAFELSSWFSGAFVVIHSGLINDEIIDEAKAKGVSEVLLKTEDLAPLKTILLERLGGSSLPASISGPDQTEPAGQNPDDLLNHLRSVFGNDDSYIKDLLKTYITENPKLLAALRQAGHHNDLEKVVKTAHRLKSAFLLMGLKELSNRSEKLELDPPADPKALSAAIERLCNLNHESYLYFKLALKKLNRSRQVMEIDVDYTVYTHKLKIKKEHNKLFIFDPIRKKYLVKAPEEFVRQLVLQYLIEEKGYNKNRIRTEKGLKVNNLNKRCDILIYDQNLAPLLLVECKSPKVKITRQSFEQIARYNLPLRVRYLLLTNGLTSYCCEMNYEENSFAFLSDIPSCSFS